MSFRRYFYLALAMIVAYGTVLTTPMILDFVFDTNVEIFVIIWLNIGLMVMRLRKIDFPMPDTRRIDVRGGLKILWWALFWPRYLLN